MSQCVLRVLSLFFGQTTVRDLIVTSVVVITSWQSSVAIAADAPDFNREVRPLLSDRCLACHGPDAEHREADLRLDDAESMTRNRNGIRVVVPGRVTDSELIRRITSTDPDVIMPPPELGKPLTAQEQNLLRSWIESGATVAAHWAYIPPQTRTVPTVKNASWPKNPIDNFILANLEREQLTPSEDADPVTLIRRLHFDLTGLPPSPDVVANFVADHSDKAVEAVVDRLLATDAHAERLATWWLDLVRFADTVGYHGDQDHHISPYRDWVIDAFANNMPFDQFTREQLAGDLLPDSDVDQKIASGYNRMLQTSHEGGVQPKEYLAIYAADRVRNVSAVWMGATIGCAQCHNHKFDPYTAKDFYALAAFFADLDEDQHFRIGSNALPTRRPPELKVHTRRERQQLLDLRQQLTLIDQQLTQTPSDVALLEQRQRLTFAIDDLENAQRLTMISVAKEPRTVRILPRGNWMDDSGDIVEPAIPEFMGQLQIPNGGRATRLDLANWLCDSKTGSGLLTARVFANRFWYLFLGTGLSTSLEDFGGQGSPPVHPELLDHLALSLVESHWDVRSLIRLIVTSRTYRQSSQWTDQLRRRDPGNNLFARQSAFRLPAEMIRDNALEISGLLNKTVGGPSIRPYQPDGYYRHLNFPQRTYVADTDSRQWRRGLYVHWQRQFLHPMLRAFDATSREECTSERSRSNTPLAALTLLNDPTFVEAARVFASRIIHATPPSVNGTVRSDKDRDRLNMAFQLAVSRNPDDAEADVLLTLLRDSRQTYRNHQDEARKAVSVGLSEVNSESDLSELASWMIITRTILNLDETITRN